jgi:signal transduction histidine kinase
MSHAENPVAADMGNLMDMPLFAAAYQRTPLRVLVVNESAGETALFKSTLETISGEAFDLTTSAEQTAALGLIGSGRFDIAFVSDSPGTGNGMDLIRKAGGRLCPTPMVLLSNKSAPGREQSYLHAGAVDILEKGELSPALLRRVIRYARFNHDTTRRLIVNEQRYRELAENASQASGEKSKFLANMSHELRTPLNAILGFSEVIQHEMFGELEGRGADKYREYINHINSSGAHLLSLINDLLDLSKIEAGKIDICPSATLIGDIIRDVSRMTTQQAETAGVEMVVEIAEDGMEIFADGRLLTQAVLNIVANAVKFSPRGGKVTLNVGIEGHNFVVSVADEGCGISKSELSQVLEPFHQVSNLETRPERGTGLGLPLARSIVELHQGGLEIASEPGVGTMVSIWLPQNVRRLEVVAG